jgi:hypothetical protein
LYRALWPVALMLGGLIGCEIPPRFVQTSAEVDGFILQKRYTSACVGLTATDPDVRVHTAKALEGLAHVKAVNTCLCTALYDADTHVADPVVARGLAASGREDLAACLAPALDDAQIRGEDRAAVVQGLGGMEAASAYAAIEGLLSDDDPLVRARAAEALRPSKAATDVLITALATDSDARVRIAAAGALDGRRADPVVTALLKATREDTDGGVRGAALAAAVNNRAPSSDELVCGAMLDDPDPRVREAAVKIFHGTKRKIALKCLDKRMAKEEENGQVRQAILDAVKASPSDDAANMLCTHINSWSRMYIKDKLAPDIEGHNIARAQNDRDWERSHECVEKALKQGGLSCYARNYLGKWVNDLGGKASTPWCPGMVKN